MSHPTNSSAPTTRSRPREHLVPRALLAAMRDREQWQDAALCAQTDPMAFFPEKGEGNDEAKAVCRRCPVQAQCLEHLLDTDERFGVWAGMTERERRRKIPAARAESAAERPPRGARHLESTGGDSGPEPAQAGQGRYVGGGESATTPPTGARPARRCPGRPTFARPSLSGVGPTPPRRSRRPGHPRWPPTAGDGRRPPPRPSRGACRGLPDRVRGPLAPPTGPEDPVDPGSGTAGDRPTRPGRLPDPPPTERSGRDRVQRAVADVLAGQPAALELDTTTIVTRATAPARSEVGPGCGAQNVAGPGGAWRG